MYQEILHYLKTFLTYGDEKAAKQIGYTTDKTLWQNYRVVIVPNGHLGKDIVYRPPAFFHIGAEPGFLISIHQPVKLALRHISIPLDKYSIDDAFLRQKADRFFRECRVQEIATERLFLFQVQGHGAVRSYHVPCPGKVDDRRGDSVKRAAGGKYR